jgi:hypothetical protein
VRRVSSVTIGPVRPSPPSRHHPGHCSAIPLRCGSAGRQDAATPAAVPLTTSRQLHPRVSVRMTTEREAPTPPPSKPLLDGYRARHGAPPEARFARTAVYSATLYAMPSHVARTVRHACKLPPLGLCHTRFSVENRMHLICVPGSQFHTYDRLMSVISQDIAQNVQKKFINFYYTREGRHEGLYTNNDNYEDATPSSSSTGF